MGSTTDSGENRPREGGSTVSPAQAAHERYIEAARSGSGAEYVAARDEWVRLHASVQYQLLLADGRTAVWSGHGGEDAARRYVDAHREAAVVAWRTWPRHGLFVGGQGIIG